MNNNAVATELNTQSIISNWFISFELFLSVKRFHGDKLPPE